MVRIKHRYLVVHLLYPSSSSKSQATKNSIPDVIQFHSPTPASVDIPHLIRLIKASVEYVYGDYGLALITSSLRVIYFSPATSTLIIRVARAHYRILWAGLTWMTDLGKPSKGQKSGDEGQGCVLRVVRISGTIRKAEEEVVRRAKEEIRRAKGGHGEVEMEMQTGLSSVQKKDESTVGQVALNNEFEDASEDEDMEEDEEGGVGIG